MKGPSAATLYGTDAANGVIVITTKTRPRRQDAVDVERRSGRGQRSDDVPHGVRAARPYADSANARDAC